MGRGAWSTPERPLTEAGRRSFLKQGALAAVGASLVPRAARGQVLPRVGIVGGGMAGVSCAWLLDGVAQAVLFESRPALGGHAHTIPVTAGGAEMQVDLGAQFFAPGPHPTYMKLVALLGLLDPQQPEADATIDVDMTISVTGAGEDVPRFVSPSRRRPGPILSPWNRQALIAFLVFTRAARRLFEEGDWLLPLGEWLEGLPVQAEARERVLFPLLAAMTGCSIEQSRALSARAAVFFVAKTLPPRPLDPVRYANSLLGLQGNVERLAQASPGLTVHLGSAVTAVHPLSAGGFRIEQSAGAPEDVDVLVLATPPSVAAPLLAELPELGEAAGVLESFEYFTSELAIHHDPVYMPAKRRHWSAFNVHADGGFAEGSVWFGALRPDPPGRAPLPLFKSWVTARSQPPAEEVFRRAFRHPLVTPDFIRGQGQLAAHQGRAGVWFAGSYTHEVDSQETALVSAMNVVRALAPGAPNLLALEA
jgi:predicted NAD/FAD-binding protein